LPPAPVSEALVEALADETGIPQSAIRAWLAGTCRLHGEHQRAALEALWRPIGGVNGRVPVRRAESAAAGILARKGAA
jgi:hypothetical protein